MRAVPEGAERMITRLKRLEAAGRDTYASVFRYTLGQFHEDVLLLERSAPYRAATEAEQSQLRTAWFAFRRSAHTWSDLVTTLRAVEEPHALVPLVARELGENREDYLSVLARGDSPRSFRDARRVLQYLNDSCHLIPKDEAAIILEVSSILYRAKYIDEVQYVSRLSRYAKSADRSLDECTAQLVIAGEILPDTLKLEAETELVKLGNIIGTVLLHESISECMRLLDTPKGVIAGMAPALIRRLAGELHNPEARTAFDMLTFLVSPSSLFLHKSTLAHVAPAIVSEMIPLLQTLPALEAVAILARFAPLINHMAWFDRSSSVLGLALSHEGTAETLPLRTALMKCVLGSPNMTNDLVTWGGLQIGFRGCRPRLEAITELLANVLKERRELGALAVSDSMCITALKALDAFGPAKKVGVVEVGALAGVPIVKVWKLGPVLLPYPVHKDQSPEVVAAAKDTLRSIGKEIGGGFMRTLTRRITRGKSSSDAR